MPVCTYPSEKSAGGKQLICTAVLWLPVGASEYQGHSSWEVKTLRPWLQVREAVDQGQGDLSFLLST